MSKDVDSGQVQLNLEKKVVEAYRENVAIALEIKCLIAENLDMDAPAKFLLWDFDLVASGIAGLAFGIIVNSLLMGAIASYAAIWAYSRLKQKRHPGYGLHYLYWQFPFRTFKRTPPSSRRFFVG